jgi:hypothetical protein
MLRRESGGRGWDAISVGASYVNRVTAKKKKFSGVGIRTWGIIKAPQISRGITAPITVLRMTKNPSSD